MNQIISRRKFIESSSKGLVAAAVIPYFLSTDITKALAANKESMNLQEYYDHFGISENMIQEVFDQALARGGDYCDLYFQHSIGNYIGLEDKEVNRAYSDVSFGVGIRVLKGNQTGYSFTEEITPKAMKLAAQTAANIADSNKIIKPIKLKLKDTPDYYPIKTPWEQISIDKKIPYLQQINDKVFSEDSRVIKSNIWFSNETSYILVVTSEGVVACDYQPMGAISVSVTAEQNGKREQNYFDLSGRRGIEFFTPENINRLAKTVSEPLRFLMQ